MTSKRLTNFRERKDDYFAQGEHSPLNDAQRARFQGLAYFSENVALALELPLATDGPGIGERLEMVAGDGVTKPFVRAGRVAFSVDGTPVTLAVFKDVERGRFFLPFRDATAGQETYPVGRYLDPQQRPNGDVVVDFNYAYNPYCAYGDGWHCPIPPRENVVGVRIAAGERSFPDRHEHVYDLDEPEEQADQHAHQHAHQHTHAPAETAPADEPATATR